LKLLLAASIALAPLSAQTTVIRNATIMTVTKGTLKGSIVVKDGKIAEVARRSWNRRRESHRRRRPVRDSGHHRLPLAHRRRWRCHEGSVSVSSMVDIKDVINPEDIAIFRALAGGVTTANILHGSANAIGGQTLVLKMRWGKDAQGLIFEGPCLASSSRWARTPSALATARRTRRHRRRGSPLPGHPHGHRGHHPRSVQRSQAYKAEWDAYNAKVAGGEHLIPPRKDLKLEPLKEILEGKRYIHAHCYRATKS